MMYKEVDNAREHFIDASTFTINNDGLITNIAQNKGAFDRVNVSMETLIINMDKFKELLKEAKI